MKIIHFDCVHGIDEAFMHNEEEYLFVSFDEYYHEKDESVEVLTCMHTTKIGSHILKCFPNIKSVITRTVWMDHIDKDFCDSHGIRYFSVGQYGPHVIATHAFSLLLSGVRDLRACHEMIEKGSYDYASVNAVDLSSKTIGVVGVGNIWKHILKYASVFGMKLQGLDVYEDKVFAEEIGLTYVSMSTLVTTSDVICLACNLTPENRHMIDEKAIREMKDGIILINIARGELIDEEALLASIEKFSFVGLDVISDESADGLARFRPYKNILITPHIAHFADSTVKARWDKTCEIINNL